MTIIIVIAAVIIFYFEYRCDNKFKAISYSFLQGLASLYCVNFIGKFIDIHINTNIFTLIVSAIGSVPAVIFLLISQIILHN